MKLKLKPNTSQMKLLHKKAPQQSSFVRRHYRLLLWLSLSLYLFFSSSSSSSSFFSFPSPSLDRSKTTISLQKTPSRALIEQAPRPKTPLKIYVYNLPPRYNGDWLDNPRCGSHLFAAEVAIHEALLTSKFRTLNPDEADFFFVPVYVSCNFSTVNGFPSLTHARSLIASSIAEIKTKFPFWNRTNGQDHIFVASHDYGACFHAMEDVAIADGIPGFLKSSILLQTFGVISPHRCQEAEHVLIPPYIPPEVLRSPPPETKKRDIFVFFRGKMEVHPKNISGRYYSKKVRTAVWNQYSNNRKFYLRRKRFDGYQSEISRSVFCLCPLGWAPWSPRLVESVALGCVPVIIADGIRLPFPDAVNWRDISLTVPESDVGELESILEWPRVISPAMPAESVGPGVRRALMLRPADRGR
ncbi:uncharacterized protein A4U43_C04F12670 [Asparagus officinalis]|uniref:Exostosin GT47 domain-containing protein n=1 Tax=Asparagus officinalis TaxID=4686 RepID=A0A5P1F114_ASPOF|nr:uncharacterized protein A4U43_C04F12670 [Asparagus officinalis]